MLSASDPYCVLEIGKKMLAKTTIIPDNNSPEWDESFSLARTTPRHETLVVRVFDADEDDVPDYDLGKVSIPLMDVIEAPFGILQHGFQLGTSEV